LLLRILKGVQLFNPPLPGFCSKKIIRNTIKDLCERNPTYLGEAGKLFVSRSSRPAWATE
jgi:hypothetical protein